MNIQIISDIHGNAQSLIQALSTPITVDLLILVGDYLNPGPKNSLLDEYDPMAVVEALNNVEAPIIAVRGNCDSEVDQMLLEFPMMNDDSYLKLGKNLIYITHGHLFDPQTDYLKKKADLYISGHTHISYIKRMDDDKFIFNPGSISLPKQDQGPTYGFIQFNLLELRDVKTHKILKTVSL